MSEAATTVLDELVGEGKKFQTAEDLAKGKKDADVYIASLLERLDTIKGEYETVSQKAAKTEALENLLNKLTKKEEDTVTDSTEKGIPENLGNQPQALSQDDIVKILEAREASQQADRNKNEAIAKVAKVYGDKTKEVLEARAVALGMTVDELTKLAERSPTAFVSLVGVSSTPSTVAMARGSSPAQGDTSSNGVRNKAFYDNLKKELGTMKFVMDSKLQAQLHRDMHALGDNWDV